MNLPPDKARLLRQYDNEKKWELICDQVRCLLKVAGQRRRLNAVVSLLWSCMHREVIQRHNTRTALKYQIINETS